MTNVTKSFKSATRRTAYLAVAAIGLAACNITNYSIYLKDDFLFSYFEYTGDDFEADMAKMEADSTTQEWWDVMMPMQEPLPTRQEGEWWANMEEVFHQD